MNYTFYRIYSKNPDVTECYIGSTKDFHTRIIGHKSMCNNKNSRHYNTKIYEYMRNNGGFEEFEIEIIDIIKFSKSDRLSHERKLMELFGATLNSILPIISSEEQRQKYIKNGTQYRQTHVEQIRVYNSTYMKEYRLNNADKINERKRQYKLRKKEEKLSQSLLAPVP